MARYGTSHAGGCAIVVGAAPNVHAEVDAALRLRPGAELLGVNFSGMGDARVEHVWTQHAELAHVIRQQHVTRIAIHARGEAPSGAVDFAWPELAWVDGSSGFAAALWALHGMRFDEVILAGVPLETGNGEMRPGYPDDALPDASILRWQAKVLRHVLNGRTNGITSMSGWTQKMLGAPA